MLPESWATLPEIVLRTVIIYGAILVGLRLFGKREIGELAPFDLVVLLLISNAVQNAMVGPDTSVLGGLVAAAVLLLLDRLLTRLVGRSRRFRRLVEGTPTLLVLRGETLPANLKREGVEPDELLTAVREAGLATIGQVELAVLEIDGKISVVPKRDAP